MTDAELRDKLASEYSDRLPTKSEWIEGKKDTHSYLAYEVRYEVEQAHSDGWDAARANGEPPEAAMLLINAVQERDCLLEVNKVLVEATQSLVDWAVINHAMPYYSEVIALAREALAKAEELSK